MKKWLVVIALIFKSTLAMGSEKSDFLCIDAFRKLVEENNNLEIAGIDYMKSENGKMYILGLGQASIENPNSLTPSQFLQRKKLAEARAKKTVSEFLNTEISTENSLLEIKKLERSSNDQKITSQVTALTKIRQELITTKSSVVFSGIRDVATWKNKDGTLIFTVIAVEIIKPSN